MCTAAAVSVDDRVAYSLGTVRCTADEPCAVSYWSRGATRQGFSNGYPGDSHSWPVSARDGADVHAIITPSISSTSWVETVYIFPKPGMDTHSYGETTTARAKVGDLEPEPALVNLHESHFMLSLPAQIGETGNVSEAYVDNIQIQPGSHLPSPVQWPQFS